MSPAARHDVIQTGKPDSVSPDNADKSISFGIHGWIWFDLHGDTQIPGCRDGSLQQGDFSRGS
jgi:hypothetical protein